MQRGKINFYLIIGFVIGLLASFSLGWLANQQYISLKNKVSSVSISQQAEEKPLEAYSIENLKNQEIKSGSFKVEKRLEEKEEFDSYLFSFEFYPNPTKNVIKKTTGVLNIPKKRSPLAIVIMLRGYVDQKIYKSGMGTSRAAEFFAKNGFITIAPDFLGYGESDKEAENIFEARFQTYTTVLSLLKTIVSIPTNPNLIQASESFESLNQLTNRLINQSSIFLWAHSNGGQIALTVLEITGENYPTTLWAPVSKPFPYSVLYYTDESEDGGKFIRSELAKFEKDYDVEKYSFTNYLQFIKAPIQIHQGSADGAVPKGWSDELVNKLTKVFDKENTVQYFVYNGSNHNLVPSWNLVVQRDLEFFKRFLNQNY